MKAISVRINHQSPPFLQGFYDSVQQVCARVVFGKGQLRDIPWMFIRWVCRKPEASNQDLLAACLADNLNYIQAEWLERRKATEFV